MKTARNAHVANRSMASVANADQVVARVTVALAIADRETAAQAVVVPVAPVMAKGAHRSAHRRSSKPSMLMATARFPLRNLKTQQLH